MTKTPSISAAAPAQPQYMSPGRWFVTTVGIVTMVILVNVFISLRMDVFGLFRDSHGRSLISSAHERKAKYLMGRSYIPANFDALIIGSSASVNWRAAKLSGYRFYDEAVEGGNATEERLLTEQALRKGRYKVALIALHPYITASHTLQDGLDSVDRSEVFGSEVSFRAEYHIIRDRIRGPRAPFAFPDGSHDLPVRPAPPRRMKVTIQSRFMQDSQAVADYRALAQELVAQGARIVYVVCPLYGDNYIYNRDLMDQYMDSVAKTLPPAPIIDLNAPQYDWFRNDPSNYIDEIHLSSLGADRLAAPLNSALQKILNAP